MARHHPASRRFTNLVIPTDSFYDQHANSMTGAAMDGGRLCPYHPGRTTGRLGHE
jgi:hypothetical protein